MLVIYSMISFPVQEKFQQIIENYIIKKFLKLNY